MQATPSRISAKRRRDDLGSDALAIVMAGGSGTRLEALTRWHCKPALSFAGQYRNIDFPLSNCVNSGIRRIGVLTQYMAHSLIQHIQQGWAYLRPELGEFVELWPAQQRRGTSWYQGTADALYQNIDIIKAHDPVYVLVLAGDHVYKMDYARMIQAHRMRSADVTLGCVEVPAAQAHHFGVLDTDAGGWVKTFAEKPASADLMPQNPDCALASMGIYVFNTDFLLQRLEADASNPESAHDFGRSILPPIIGGRSRILAYPFRDAATRAQGYWRDVGTLDSYWLANMEMLAETPLLDLNDDRWPIWTYHEQAPPPRFTGKGVARESIVSAGCLVAGEVRHSVLSTGCHVDVGSLIEDSVVLPNVRVGKNCRIRRAIVDTGCVVLDDTVIGADLFSAGNSDVSRRGVALFTAEREIEASARAHTPSRVA